MKYLLQLTVFIVSLGISSGVAAASAGGNVSVSLISSFTFNELSVVDFKIIPRTNGTCSMNKRGVLSGQCAGSDQGNIGEVEIEGASKQWVTISVTALSSVGGVTYMPKLAANNGTQQSVKLNNAGRKVIKIIGDLVLNNATSGLKQLNYLITVNYE